MHEEILFGKEGKKITRDVVRSKQRCTFAVPKLKAGFVLTETEKRNNRKPEQEGMIQRLILFSLKIYSQMFGR